MEYLMGDALWNFSPFINHREIWVCKQTTGRNIIISRKENSRLNLMMRYIPVKNSLLHMPEKKSVIFWVLVFFVVVICLVGWLPFL